MQSASTSAAATIERWLAEAAATGVRDNYTAKRRDLRTGWLGSLMVQFAEEPHRAPLFVRALDVSPSGIGFYARQDVAVGTRLHVSAENPDETVSVTVTRCTRTLNGYHVGAEFDVQR